MGFGFRAFGLGFGVSRGGGSLSVVNLIPETSKHTKSPRPMTTTLNPKLNRKPQTPKDSSKDHASLAQVLTGAFSDYFSAGTLGGTISGALASYLVAEFMSPQKCTLLVL